MRRRSFIVISLEAGRGGAESESVEPRLGARPRSHAVERRISVGAGTTRSGFTHRGGAISFPAQRCRDRWRAILACQRRGTAAASAAKLR